MSEVWGEVRVTQCASKSNVQHRPETGSALTTLAPEGAPGATTTCRPDGTGSQRTLDAYLHGGAIGQVQGGS